MRIRTGNVWGEGGVCSGLVGNLKESVLLEDLGMDGKIILTAS
jgi:hypothetical protein